MRLSGYMLIMIVLCAPSSCHKSDDTSSGKQAHDAAKPREMAITMLDEIVFPLVSFKGTSLEEAVDWISQRGRELNSDVFDEFASGAGLNKQERQRSLTRLPSAKEAKIESVLDLDQKVDDLSRFSSVTFSAKDIKLLDLVAEIAERAKADAYLSSEGIIFTPEGSDPTAAWSDVEIWKVLRKKSASGKDETGEQSEAPIRR